MLLENIKRKHIEKGLDIESKFDVRCTLINGKIASPDSRLLLEKAVSIFHVSNQKYHFSFYKALRLIDYTLYE